MLCALRRVMDEAACEVPDFAVGFLRVGGGSGEA